MSLLLIMQEEFGLKRLFSYESAVPSEWKKSMWAIYTISSFNYCIIGMILWYESNTPIFSSLWFFQGYASYLNDVYTLGEPSIWKPIDRISSKAMIFVAMFENIYYDVP